MHNQHASKISFKALLQYGTCRHGYNQGITIKRNVFLIIAIFSCLQLRLSLPCITLDQIKNITTFTFVDQSPGYLKYASYSLALLVAAYPLYHGCKCMQECILNPNTTEGCSYEELCQLKTLDETINVSYLGTMVKKVTEELKIPKQTLSKIRFEFYNKDQSGCNAAATSRSISFYLSFFDLTHEEQSHIIGHEFTHITEKHKLIAAIISLLIPIGSYAAAQIYSNLLKNITHSKGKELSTNEALCLAILIPTISFCCNSILFHKLNCYLEKRADLNTTKSFIQTLGGVYFFNPYEIRQDTVEIDDTQNLKEIKKLPTNKKWSNYLPKKIPSWKSINFFLETLYGFNAHPTNLERFSYLSKKLVILEKKKRTKIVSLKSQYNWRFNFRSFFS